MSNEINDEATRYEIVLLEDDPETLGLIKGKLEARDIIVHAYVRGDEALQKILDDPNIGALVTDIEIKYPFPDGTRNGLQGYDVANRILTHSPSRLLSVIVLTALGAEGALDSVNVFRGKAIYFSKEKWTKLSEEKDIEETFDALAMIVKELVELTPYRWLEEARQLYPKSRWVCEQKDGKKIYPPYWEIYRKIWLSHGWKQIEQQIGQKALEIVQSYRQGETLRLRGDHLSLTENPNEITFQEHLVGRRVVYALRAIEPAYWERMIRGERPEQEEIAELSAETWVKISTEKVKNLVNQINQKSANLKHLKQQLDELQKKAEDLENKSSLSKAEEKELEDLLEKIRKIRDQISQINDALRPLVDELVDALKNEPPAVQEGFNPYLRYLDADFSEVDWTKKPPQTGGGRDPLTQTLLLLGIRKQDMQDENPENWKLLLPEERKWLRRVVELDV